MAPSRLSRLAVPSVCALIALLSYGPQLLFRQLEPGPPSTRQALLFHLLTTATWWSYARTCCTDPGRLPTALATGADEGAVRAAGQRWCGKCRAVKPSRAHHCRVCAR
jgi:palmitoyltransferase